MVLVGFMLWPGQIPLPGILGHAAQPSQFLHILRHHPRPPVDDAPSGEQESLQVAGLENQRDLTGNVFSCDVFFFSMLCSFLIKLRILKVCLWCVSHLTTLWPRGEGLPVSTSMHRLYHLMRAPLSCSPSLQVECQVGAQTICQGFMVLQVAPLISDWCDGSKL